MRILSRLLWMAFFLGPLGYLLLRLLNISEFKIQFAANEFLIVLAQTLGIALSSTIGIMLVGLFIAVCLFSSKLKPLFKLLLLLPAFTPSLLVITSLVAWSDVFGILLRPSFSSVVLVHIVMEIGFAGVLLHDLIRSKMYSQLKLAVIEGASRTQIIFSCVKNLKSEVLFVASAFFLFSFTSFSVSLILGGSSGKNLEVLAYEQLYIRADLWGSVLISLFQMGVYALMTYFIAQPEDDKFTKDELKLKQIGLPCLTEAIAIIVLLISYFGIVFDMPMGIQTILSNQNAMDIIPSLTLNSLGLSLSAAIAGFLLFATLIYFYSDSFLRRFLLSYGAVSVVFMGIAIYLLKLPVYWKLVYAYAILFFPIAFRLYGPDLFSKLKPQYEILRTLGASRWLMFTRVLFPQSLPLLLRVSGFIAIWVVGDYGITSIITGENLSLALFTKSLLTSYRIEAASVMSGLLLFLVGLIYLSFESIAYVCRKKLFN